MASHDASAADADLGLLLRDQIRAAFADETPLSIVGGGSKAFFGRSGEGRVLAAGRHRGIVSYEPTELVVTARGGTPLRDLEAVLEAHGQMLAFEPPRFDGGDTIGGTVAAAQSGPRRPYAGAVRDFVLGVRLLDGKGEILSFGGQVMKNVAGYDLSRLMVGAMGTLGVLLEISLQVLPLPEHEVTLHFELDAGRAISAMNEWARRPLPLSAAVHEAGRLQVRLSGSERGVEAAAARLGGERGNGTETWLALRDQRAPFFTDPRPLWRISVPPASPPLRLPGEVLIDWGGALRWTRSEADPGTVREVAEGLGGHAMLFRNGDRKGSVHHPLSPGVERLHRRLKDAFDPRRLLNRGRMYESW